MGVVTIPYRPREAFAPFHARTEQEAVLVCHRRAGKTVAICNDAQKRCLLNPRANPPPRYAWFYPTRVRAKDIAWGYLKYYSSKIPGARPIESELAIEYPNMGRVTLYGADNARGVGLWLDGVYYDEADEIPRSTIADVAPALADYHGFVVYAGMLKGRYNLWDRFVKAQKDPKIYTMLMRASESGIITPDELLRQRRMMGDAAYEMQLECNANAAIANAIYGLEMDQMRKENRIKIVAADPGSPLYAFFDVGHSISGDDWACWLVQLVGRDILLLQYHARTGKIPSYYADILRGWEELYGQKLDSVYLPHDGTRKDQLGKSTKDHLEDAGVRRIKTVIRTPAIWNGINTMRALFARVCINEPGCGEPWMLGEEKMPSGIDCLDFYTKKMDATNKGMILDVPEHNQFSHGADALRTFAEAYGQNMLDGTSVYGQQGSHMQIDVSRTRVTPGEGQRRPMRLNVTR